MHPPSLAQIVAAGFERIADAIDALADRSDRNTGLVLEALDALEAKIEGRAPPPKEAHHAG